MRIQSALVIAAVGVAGCGRVDFDPIDRPECTAQRAVYIVAGTGGLAWFTLVWPVPDVITGFQAGFAYDDPTLATVVVTGPDHPLYARRGLWAESPSAQPSVYVAGNNETHTGTPITTVEVNGSFVIQAGVDGQHALSPALPALGFIRMAPYVAGMPEVSDIDGAVGALRAVTPISPEAEGALRPDPMTLASWYSASPTIINQHLAEQLLFTANAFRAGLIGSVLIEFGDDPHGAFGEGTAAARADDVVGILRGFQAELASAIEPACRVDGAPVALADNVVVVVFGDTPKDPYAAIGWPDGTAGNSNWVYVRGNGFLRPGWFGAYTSAAGRTGFDPTTGGLDASFTQGDDAAAADRAILYAITRGDTGAVAAFAPGAYQGLVAPAP